MIILQGIEDVLQGVLNVTNVEKSVISEKDIPKFSAVGKTRFVIPQFSAAGTITNVKRWLKLVFIFSLSSCQTNFVDKKCFRVYRKLITYPVTIVVNNLFPRVLSLALRNKFGCGCSRGSQNL